MTTRFDRASAVTELSPGRFRATLAPEWWVVRGPHGGYLATILLRCLAAVVGDDERVPRSLTVHFVSAPAQGDLDISATVERTGKSLTSASARATQNGEVVALALGAFSVPWEGGFEFSDATMPTAMAFEDAFRVPVEGPDFPPFLGNFDMRWAIGDPPFTGSEHARIGGWFRLAEAQPADAFVVATLMDAWPPVVFPPATTPLVAPTIDLTIHFREPLPVAGAAPDDFYLGFFSSKLSHEGFFEEDGELWSPDGRLLAQSRQLALTIPRR
ncbi:MAG TPA: thioesterase family protein [Actinomycetota bacterium]|nr:thioesterase family protein [Actinomycetota bacterium]